MLVDWILLIVGVVWVLAATCFDVFSKTREIPDLLNYSLIGIGFGVRGIYSVMSKDWWFFLYGLIGFGVFFLIANLMYYTKQWGGGDCKLLMGLGVIFATYPDVGLFSPLLGFNFLAILFINILIAGAIYGFVYTGVLGVIRFEDLKKKIKKNDLISGFLGIVCGGLMIFLSVLFIRDRILMVIGVVLGLLIFVLLSLVKIFKLVEECCMHRWKKIKDLVEGDWLAEDVKVHGKVIVSKKGLGLNKKDFALLKKHKVRRVHVKEGLPFLPAFLIGLIFSLIWGNLLFMIAF